MPITLGTNLTKEGNAISAKYNDLFQKLNVAKAWTNTQSTGSGGTAVVLYHGGILTTMAANDPNTCFGGDISGMYGMVDKPQVIINGKIYGYNSGSLVQIGTKSDYKEVVSYYSALYNRCFAIDTSGKLWYIKDSTETQIGTDTTWSRLGYSITRYCGINNGRLYIFNESNLYNQVFTSLTKCTCINGYASDDSTLCCHVICDGYLYYLNGSTSTMIGSNNNWIKLDGHANRKMVLNDSGELYYLNSSTITKQNVSNVVDFSIHDAFCVTSDNKLYYGNSVSSTTNNWIQLFPDVKWTRVLSYSVSDYTAYAIGDGKLYYIKGTGSTASTFTATQLGTEEGYTKLEGGIGYSKDKSTSSDKTIALAWTGDATSVVTTVYTTKNPQENDNTYEDTNLTSFSEVKSVNGSSSITDQYRTYNRDTTKDSVFNGIPTETMHEEVSVIDMLRITNPNS